MGSVTPAQVKKVIGLIESGESERKACKLVGLNRNTFRSAALKHEASDHYARALAALAQDQVEKVEVAIDDMRKGKIDAQMARVEIDARKWFASKFLPKRYGDKLDMTSGGERLGVGISAEQAEQLIRARANRRDS
jgi:hypothetical protein